MRKKSKIACICIHEENLDLKMVTIFRFPYQKKKRRYFKVMTPLKSLSFHRKKS